MVVLEQFIQQFTRLLNESPGNIVYHLVTLFAIQATLGLALSQWRRNREDRFAFRLTWAAGAIMVTRLLLLLGGLWANNNEALFLPPLEQAMNAASVALLVWALVPPGERLPKLGHVLLVFALVITGVLYAFFAPQWVSATATTEIPQVTVEIPQAINWSLWQLVMLGYGGLLLLIKRPADGLLRFFILLFVAAALVMLLFIPTIAVLGVPLVTSAESSRLIPWARLANLTAFPLLVILAFRHFVDSLLAVEQQSGPSEEQAATVLRLSAGVIHSLDLQQAIHKSVVMIQDLIDASYIGLAVKAIDEPELLDLVSIDTRVDNARQQTLHLELARWPTFQLAMEKAETIELTHHGASGWQLENFYNKVGLEELGPLLIEPLVVNNTEVGVLLLSAANDVDTWSDERRALAPYIAAYTARALHNATIYHRTLFASGGMSMGGSSSSSELAQMERKYNQALADLQELSNQLHDKEAVLAEQRQTMTALLAESHANPQTNAEIQALKQESAKLQKALKIATDKNSLAASSATQTKRILTDNMQRLDQAHDYIQELEDRLSQKSSAQPNELPALLGKFRRPIQAVDQYSRTILSEGSSLTPVERNLLMDINTNAVRMQHLLGKMDESLANDTTITTPGHQVRQLLETVIDDIMPQIQKKQLQISLALAEPLPTVSIPQNQLRNLVSDLLQAISEQSPPASRLTIKANHLPEWDGIAVPRFSLAIIDNLHKPTSLNGLKEAKNIASQYGGRISIDDNQGIMLNLPALAAAAPTTDNPTSDKG